MNKTDGCWLWAGAKSQKGYGFFVASRGKPELAHRVAFLLTTGEWPALVRHLCHERRCVRPDHLATGTHQDNSDDMVRAGRSLVGTRNHNAKMTESRVVAIRQARAAGASVTELARESGVTTTLISMICTGKGWRHVGGPLTRERHSFHSRARKAAAQ